MQFQSKVTGDLKKVYTALSNLARSLFAGTAVSKQEGFLD